MLTTIGILLLPLLTSMFWIEPSTILTQHVHLDIPKWHQEHQDLKFVVISDLHMGSFHMDWDKLEELMNRVNALEPDVVLLLGDYVTHGGWLTEDVSPQRLARTLSQMKTRYGIFAVLGNHEGWIGGTDIQEALEANQIQVLQNESVVLEVNRKHFGIIGIEDLWTGKPKIHYPPKSFKSDTFPLLLLAHNPDVFPHVPEQISLTLAGHTHGGQIHFTGIGRPWVPSKYGSRYAEGHIVEEGRHLFVTTGVGTSLFPGRLNVPPEIVVLTLE